MVAISHSAAERRSTQIVAMPSPGCTVVYTGARPTVRLAGRADRLTINQVGGVLRGLRAVGVRRVVIDMSRAVDCDGRLLAVLARARNQLADAEGQLEITGVNLPQVLDALGAATLEEVFLIYDAVRRDNPPPVAKAQRADEFQRMREECAQ